MSAQLEVVRTAGGGLTRQHDIISLDDVFPLVEELIEFMDEGCVQILSFDGKIDQSAKVRKMLEDAASSRNYRALIGPVRNLQRMDLKVIVLKPLGRRITTAKIEAQFETLLLNPRLPDVLAG